MIFNLYKPRGISSNSFLQWFKKRYNIGKAGFLGTLDPLARGVLPVFTATDTKLINLIDDSIKKYTFTMLLGYHSASLDSEICVQRGRPVKNILLKQWQEVLTKFQEYDQQAPCYSAIQIKGQTLYKIARQGKSIKPPYRRVKIYDSQITAVQKNSLTISITCSKGFYVRSLAKDLADYIGQDALVSDIKRVMIGSAFTLDNAIKLQQLINTTKISQIPSIHWQDLNINLPTIMIKEQNLIKNICNGQQVRLYVSDDMVSRLVRNDANITTADNSCCICNCHNELIAIAKVRLAGLNEDQQRTSKGSSKDSLLLLQPTNILYSRLIENDK